MPVAVAVPNIAVTRLGNMKYKVLIVDDHTMFRSGLRKIIQECPNFEVIGEASDGLALLELLKRVKPDLITMDISMPNLGGIEATREIKKYFPEIKVLILSMIKDGDYLYQSIASGAEGYLLKEDADTELIQAMKRVMSGENFLSSLLSHELTGLVFKKFRYGSDNLSAEILTVQEKNILKLIAEGKSSKDISRLLYLSIRTVYRHRAEIMKKLDFKNTAELVKFAINEGYINQQA